MTNLTTTWTCNEQFYAEKFCYLVTALQSRGKGSNICMPGIKGKKQWLILTRQPKTLHTTKGASVRIQGTQVFEDNKCK